MKFRNPIIPGFHPDPSICRAGEDYYLVNSSFEFFPGVPIYHSRDLIHWKQIGNVLTRPSQLPLEKSRVSGGIYAPSIRYHRGRFYMVTTNKMMPAGHFYVHTDDPAGEWSEPIAVPLPGIDPSLFFDDDDSCYFTSTGDGLSQARINIATGELLETPRPFWKGLGLHSTEGPHLYKVNGVYYALLAEGGTEYGHCVTIARGPTPYGPWESCPHNPILSHRSNSSPIQSTGHADLIQAHDGSWWMVFLATRPTYYPPIHHLGRETFIAPVTWKDGWPVVGEVKLEMDIPTLAPKPWPAEPTRDDFDSPRLRPCWNFLRNPRSANYSLSARNGFMRLHGTNITLNDIDSPTFLARRQEHFYARATTAVESDAHEAGLSVFMNNRHHYEIAVTRSNEIILRQHIGVLEQITASEKINPGPVQVRIEAVDPKTYQFSYCQNNTLFKSIGTAESRYLGTEIAGGFTGVYLGIYSVNGQADFDYFDYEQTQPDPLTRFR